MNDIADLDDLSKILMYDMADLAAALGKSATISPRTADLAFAKGKVPTPRGSILINWKNGKGFNLDLTIPEAVGAKVEAPAAEGLQGVFVNGVKADAKPDDGRWILMNAVSGKVCTEVK
ncbi:MAG: hypothetical protein RLZZ505_2138 [Verrucomicrobiota bacterium]|jgi:hypothetical protein